jgi:hypothetical protein
MGTSVDDYNPHNSYTTNNQPSDNFYRAMIFFAAYVSEKLINLRDGAHLRLSSVFLGNECLVCLELTLEVQQEPAIDLGQREGADQRGTTYAPNLPAFRAPTCALGTFRTFALDTDHALMLLGSMRSV